MRQRALDILLCSDFIVEVKQSFISKCGCLVTAPEKGPAILLGIWKDCHCSPWLVTGLGFCTDFDLTSHK